MLVVDRKLSEDVWVVFSVSQKSVLGPWLFSMYTSDQSMVLVNTLVGYADESSLLNLPKLLILVSEYQLYPLFIVILLALVTAGENGVRC